MEIIENLTEDQEEGNLVAERTWGKGNMGRFYRGFLEQ